MSCVSLNAVSIHAMIEKGEVDKVFYGLSEEYENTKNHSISDVVGQESVRPILDFGKKAVESLDSSHPNFSKFNNLLALLEDSSSYVIYNEGEVKEFNISIQQGEKFEKLDSEGVEKSDSFAIDELNLHDIEENHASIQPIAQNQLDETDSKIHLMAIPFIGAFVILGLGFALASSRNY